jgi:hypothetical protein
MKIRSFTLTLSLIATFLIVALPLVAEDDKYNQTEWDECIGGSGSITKGDDKFVRAKAICQANNRAEEGWYWGHAQVLPKHSDYEDSITDDISGRFHETASTRRKGRPKDNGRSYISMWARDSEDYRSILIDLPKD